MQDLFAAVKDLTAAVDGIDWDPGLVQSSIQAIHQFGRRAAPDDLNASLQTLVERLRRFRTEDGDGTAHAALTAGTLVEFGACPDPLAKVLAEKIPLVLQAARECANVCLADPRTPAECPDDEELQILTEVDHRPILTEVFRDYLAEDRSRAVLAYLEQWTLAAVAAWTRSRESLARAVADQALINLADALAASDAQWLRTLLGVQLDATWTVFCPLQRRGFRILLDGVVSNQDLHVQLAAALVPLGIDGTACSEDVVAYLEGRTERPAKWVAGTWNLYDYRAARLDLSDGDQVPPEYWVWAEGIPNDIPRLTGQPVLIVGPASINRSWTLARTFSSLPSRVRVVEELEPSQYDMEISRS